MFSQQQKHWRRVCNASVKVYSLKAPSADIKHLILYPWLKCHEWQQAFDEWHMTACHEPSVFVTMAMMARNEWRVALLVRSPNEGVTVEVRALLSVISSHPQIDLVNESFMEQMNIKDKMSHICIHFSSFLCHLNRCESERNTGSSDHGSCIATIAFVVRQTRIDCLWKPVLNVVKTRIGSWIFDC